MKKFAEFVKEMYENRYMEKMNKIHRGGEKILAPCFA